MNTIRILRAGAVLSAMGFLQHCFLFSGPMYEPGMVREANPAGTPSEKRITVEGEKYFQVSPEIRLAYHTRGAGRAVLVVHGGPGAPYPGPWKGLAEFEDRYQFYYYQQRGTGRSTRPFDRFESSSFYNNMRELEGTLGIGAQLEDIESIRRILGEEKLIIVAHSYGAFLATLYAAEFPERVERLALYAPADLLRLPGPGKDLFETVRMLLPPEKKAEFEVYVKEYLDFSNLFEKSESELGKLNARFVDYYLAAMQSQGAQALPRFDDWPGSVGAPPAGWMVQAQYFSMGRKHDYRGAAKNCKAPVLVLHGEKDMQLPRVAREYVAEFPNARYKQVSGAGHFGFQKTPRAFALTLREFLKAPAR